MRPTLDDRLFAWESRPQGVANCPKCGKACHYHDHTLVWKCTGCREAWLSDELLEAGADIVWPEAPVADLESWDLRHPGSL